LRRALSLLRPQPHYRAERFAAGLRAAGYEVCQAIPDPRPGDVILTWNRYGHYDDECRRFERWGADVLIAENSYLAGVVPGKWHALARSYHNDAATVREGSAERWKALGVDLMPWRTDGGHVLVCPNRLFGVVGRAMPIDWAADVCARLARVTDREIRLRPHPGNKPPEKPLADDLAGAWATVIWSSSAGAHSLIAGVPVVCEAPHWICEIAAANRIEWIDQLPRMLFSGNTREAALQLLAWAIWSVEEIESGVAFKHLLHN